MVAQVVSKNLGVLTLSDPKHGEWTSTPVRIPLFPDDPLVFIVQMKEDSGYVAEKAETAIFNIMSARRHTYTQAVYDRMLRQLDWIGYDMQWYAKNKDCEQGFALDLLAIELLGMKNIADLWLRIKPLGEIYITTSQDTPDTWLAGMQCACAWEEEHGLDLAFINGNELSFDVAYY